MLSGIRGHSGMRGAKGEHSPPCRSSSQRQEHAERPHGGSELGKAWEKPVNPSPAAALRAGAPESPGMFRTIQPRLFHSRWDLALWGFESCQISETPFEKPQNAPGDGTKKTSLSAERGMSGPPKSQTHRTGGEKVTWILWRRGLNIYISSFPSSVREILNICAQHLCKNTVLGGFMDFLLPESEGLGQHLRNTWGKCHRGEPGAGADQVNG